MTTRFTINTELLLSYINKSEVSIEALADRIKDIHLFLEGEKMPTYNQLEKIARQIHIPTGLLLLQDEVNLNTQRLSFRTHNSKRNTIMSAELRETIIEMQEKQEFLEEYIDSAPQKLQLNYPQNHKSYHQLANLIRDALSIETNHHSESKNNPLAYFRDKISSIGIFVFFNGKIKENNHRTLDATEFRGFSLKSKTAPIIFVNQRDSKNAQLFTLIHELVHLFLDDEGVSREDEQKDYDHIKEEAFVNKVAAELLVPECLITNEQTKDLDYLSSRYNVSRHVIARRLFDTGMVTHAEYNGLVHKLNAKLKTNSDTRKSRGGNYHNTTAFRIDSTFFRIVHNAINQEQLTHTEAFRLIGTGYAGYKALEAKYG